MATARLAATCSITSAVEFFNSVAVTTGNSRTLALAWDLDEWEAFITTKASILNRVSILYTLAEAQTLGMFEIKP
jgi:hypothetical protein